MAHALREELQASRGRPHSPGQARVAETERYAGSTSGLRVAICAAGEIWGGVERLVLTTAELLYAEKILTGVLLFHGGRLQERLQQAHIPVAIVGRGRGFNAGSITAIRRALKQQAPNVLHVHGYKAAILGGLAARACGVRVVKTEHGFLEPGSGLAHLRLTANTLLDRLLAPALVDGVAFVSGDLARHLQWLYPFAKRRVIHNGIQPPAHGRLEGAAEVDPRLFNIGIIGRVTPVKGHEYLLNAMTSLSHLSDLRLWVVGDGPSLRACIEQSRAMGLADRVQFVGFRENATEYLRRFQLLIMPSLHEGLPLVLLEAMSLRVPVVASAVGGLREVLVDGLNGYLVPPRSSEPLAIAIEALYRNEELRTQLAANALRTVSEEYSIGRLLDQYAQLYHETLMESA